MPFAKWKARLAGEKVISHPEPDENDEGYYRKSVTKPGVDAKGSPNGKKIVTGYRPVAIYVDNGEVVATIDGNKDLSHDQTCELWTYVLQNPISYETYCAVAQRGERWPDADKFEPAPPADVIPASNRDVERRDNAPPDEVDTRSLDQIHREAIDAARGAAEAWLQPGAIKTEKDAATAYGSKNRIAELRLAADKAGKAIYEPIFRQYQAEQKKWSPIVADATATEKKIDTAVLTFREIERKRVAAEALRAALKAAEAQRLIDEEAARIEKENARNADRAIAAGEPEPDPIVVEAPPVEVAPLPQQAPLTPTYGSRKPREEVKKWATVVDGAKVYEHFKANADLIALLHKLAETAVRTGLNVPGVTVHEGLVR